MDIFPTTIATQSSTMVKHYRQDKMKQTTYLKYAIMLTKQRNTAKQTTYSLQYI